MKTSRTFVYTCLSVLICFSTGIQSVIGQIPAYFVLDKEVSSRAAGIGGAFLSVTGDPHALFYNPAGLIGVQDKSVGLTYINDFLDINSGQFVYSGSRNASTKYAVGINYINYGDFDKRDLLGNDLGNFSANDLVLVGGFARQYDEKIYWGASAKVLYSQIDEFSSSAILGDVGVIYIVPSQRLNLSVSFSNFGAVLSEFVETKEDLPTSAKFGAAKRLAHAPILLSIEYRAYFEGDGQFLGGSEIYFSDTFRGRVGYNSFGSDQKVGDEDSPLAGFSFGFGLDWEKYVIDYAYSSLGAIGSQNRLTLSWAIN